jgi:hypothetical protein
MTFVRFGLIVTGQAEERFLPKLFKGLTRRAPCHFEVIRRIGQRTPRGAGRQLAMAGSGKIIADRDMTDFGLPARGYLDRHGEHAHVLLIDDLEWDRRDARREVFERYRKVLDTVLFEPGQRRRAGVFFLVMMLEAYYFADPRTLCEALRIEALPMHLRDLDVETIRHPKNELKRLVHGFREIEDGQRIIEQLDLERVLADPGRCAALRTLFAWCLGALGMGTDPSPSGFDGVLCPVTSPQLSS